MILGSTITTTHQVTTGALSATAMIGVLLLVFYIVLPFRDFWDKQFVSSSGSLPSLRNWLIARNFLRWISMWFGLQAVVALAVRPANALGYLWGYLIATSVLSMACALAALWGEHRVYNK